VKIVIESDAHVPCCIRGEPCDPAPPMGHVGEYVRLRRGAHGRVVLSPLQRQILLKIGEMVLRIKVHGSAEGKAALNTWGIPWRPSTGDARWTPSQRSAWSRSLRRLEQRGLVLRRNWRNPHGRRTTHIVLSQDGEAVAQWLIAQTGRNVNRYA
jgi:hypothetical protein